MTSIEPLLTGDLAKRARQAIQGTAQALRNPNPSFLFCRYRKQEVPTLGALDPWTALLLAYWDHAGDASPDAPRIEEIFAESSQFLQREHRLDLYGGWCGLGWVLAHLTEADTEAEDGEDDLTELDAGVVELLRTPRVHLEHDLTRGLVGFGVYLLERLPRPRAEEGLRQLVRRLEANAQVTPHGLTWPKSDGRVNLGVAHGVLGIFGLLALCHRSGIEVERTSALLEEAVPWLLQQEVDTLDRPRYPRKSGPHHEPGRGRIAWCYGDLGVAAVLHLAGRCLERPSWKTEAIRIANHAARVPLRYTGVVDPGLCHGSAGNAHIFHRLYRESGEPSLREAALQSFQQTLGFCRPQTGIGGFQSYFPAGVASGWRDDPAFLMGSTGIALALLAGLQSSDPAWDRVLLLS